MTWDLFVADYLPPIVGSIAAVLFYFGLSGRWFTKSKQFKEERDSYSPDIYSLDVATIADDLVPLLDKLDLQGATIRIVGGDAAYFVLENAERLLAGIKGWAERGAHIEYHLVCSDVNAKKRLLDLSNELDGKLKIFVIEDENAAELFLHRHPIIVKLRDGSVAYWREAHHPHNSMFAYNVVYASPIVMKKELALSKEAEKYGTMLSSGSRVVAAA